VAPVELTGIHGFVGVSAPKRHQPEHDHCSSIVVCSPAIAIIEKFQAAMGNKILTIMLWNFISKLSGDTTKGF
jgi:hypothetical protein